MPLKVTGFSMWLHFQPPTSEFVLDYTPLTPTEGQPGRRGISEYTTQVRKSFNDLPPELLRKLSRIADYALGALDLPEVDIGGVTARGTATLFYYQLILEPTLRLHVVYQSTAFAGSSLPESDVPISEATMRLIDNILPMCEQLAWDHLRGRFRVPDSPISGRKKVFLSYRKGGAE